MAIEKRFDQVMTHRSVHPRRAFTLVEVLAAMLLVSIALPVAMKGVSTCSNAALAARRRAEAGALAESKLSELIVTGVWQNGVLAGDCGADWPDYHWTADTQTWTPTQAVDNGNGNTISELDVHVTWIGHHGEESVTLGTLVYASGSSQ